MFQCSRVWLIAVAAAGVLAGTAFGIGSAVASGGSASTAGAAPWPPNPSALARGPGGLPSQLRQRIRQAQAGVQRLRDQIAGLGIAGPAVHQTEVVPYSKGGFETVTVDSGTLEAVSGQTLTIDEAFNGHSYGTVSVTVPPGTGVTRDLQAASLSDLQKGDWVSVMATRNGDRVTAWDAGSPARLLGLGQGRGLPAPPAP